MKHSELLLIFIVGFILACVLFSGFMTAVQKSFKKAPKPQTAFTVKDRRELDWEMDEIQERHRQMVEDQKQRIKDMQQMRDY